MTEILLNELGVGSSSRKARVFVFPNWTREVEKTTKESCEAAGTLAEAEEVLGGFGFVNDVMCRVLHFSE